MNEIQTLEWYEQTNFFALQRILMDIMYFSYFSFIHPRTEPSKLSVDPSTAKVDARAAARAAEIAGSRSRFGRRATTRPPASHKLRELSQRSEFQRLRISEGGMHEHASISSNCG